MARRARYYQERRAGHPREDGQDGRVRFTHVRICISVPDISNLFVSFRDNYLSAKDTFWSAWSDNQIRDWLIEHGYMRTDAQVKRDELIKLANEK